MPKIKFSLLGAVLFVMAFADRSGESMLTLAAAALHEVGHMIMLVLLGLGIRRIAVTPLGLEIDTKRGYRSFFEEITVSLAGCAVNFITFALLNGRGGAAELLADASLLLGILNIMPVRCLDGGEALLAGLSLVCLPDKAERICRRVSFLTLFLLWIPAAYIFLMSGYNYSLFIMCLWLFGKLFL